MNCRRDVKPQCKNRWPNSTCNPAARTGQRRDSIASFVRFDSSPEHSKSAVGAFDSSTDQFNSSKDEFNSSKDEFKSLRDEFTTASFCFTSLSDDPNCASD